MTPFDGCRTEMNTKFSREELLRQLEERLEVSGASLSRWPRDCRARLAAFIETDAKAARLLAEIQALDRVLARAPECAVRGALQAKICAAAAKLRQDGGHAAAAIVVDFRDGSRRSRNGFGSGTIAARSFWGGAALLAASLILGVYIGASGDAVPTLRNIEAFASNDLDAGFVLSGSLFGPSALHEREQL
jgi:hypothetical protein